jgi:hypothetical protein
MQIQSSNVALSAKGYFIVNRSFVATVSII